MAKDSVVVSEAVVDASKEGVKSPLRVALMLAVSFGVVQLAKNLGVEVNEEVATTIGTLILVGVDRFLHELGKLLKKKWMVAGLVRF